MILAWQDSPLVNAVKEGHVLVGILSSLFLLSLVDEADKCPLKVVCVLKSLVDGEMTLSDGWKILDLHKFPHSTPLPCESFHPNSVNSQSTSFPVIQTFE